MSSAWLCGCPGNPPKVTFDEGESYCADHCSRTSAHLLFFNGHTNLWWVKMYFNIKALAVHCRTNKQKTLQQNKSLLPHPLSKAHYLKLITGVPSFASLRSFRPLHPLAVSLTAAPDLRLLIRNASFRHTQWKLLESRRSLLAGESMLTKSYLIVELSSADHSYFRLRYCQLFLQKVCRGDEKQRSRFIQDSMGEHDNAINHCSQFQQKREGD